MWIGPKIVLYEYTTQLFRHPRDKQMTVKPTAITRTSGTTATAGEKGKFYHERYLHTHTYMKLPRTKDIKHMTTHSRTVVDFTYYVRILVLRTYHRYEIY